MQRFSRLFALALLLRLLAVVALDSPAGILVEETWFWGYEESCIATSLAEGRGFRDPWRWPTGPTAWLAPAYPVLLAALMKVFGTASEATAWGLHTLQSLLSATTCLLLVLLGRAVGARRAGWVAGWLLAVYPLSIWHAAQTVWDTSLAAFALTAFLTFVLSRGERPSIRACVGCGLAYGLLLLVNPAPLGLFPAIAYWVFQRRSSGSERRAATLGLLSFGLAGFVVVLPWCLRNQHQVGKFHVRSNLGVELYVGNNDLADGRFQKSLHPSDNLEELARFQELGEKGYADWATEAALAWIRQHPQRFVRLTLRRLQNFWVGESPFADTRRAGELRPADDPKSWIKWIVHAATGAAALLAMAIVAWRYPAGRFLAAALLLFPLPYYATHFMERYRYPIEPIMIFLVAWLGVWVLESRTKVRMRPS